MATTLDVVNNALTRVGSGPISSIDEDTRPARTMKNNLSFAIDYIMSIYLWHFAVKRTELILDGETPAFEYTQQHRLPDDAYSVFGVLDANNDTVSDYDIEGRLLLSDSSVIRIHYTFFIESDFGLVQPYAANAMAAYLAWLCSYRLNPKSRPELWFQYQRDLAAAKTTDARHAGPKFYNNPSGSLFVLGRTSSTPIGLTGVDG